MLVLTLCFYYGMVYIGFLDKNPVLDNDIHDNEVTNSSKREQLPRDGNLTSDGDASVFLVPPEQFSRTRNCYDWSEDFFRILTICRGGRGRQGRGVLLTLFTSILEPRGDEALFDNTLRLHAALGEQVQPLLFVASPARDAALVRRACRLGWHVVVAPQCDGYGVVLCCVVFCVCVCVCVRVCACVREREKEECVCV